MINIDKYIIGYNWNIVSNSINDGLSEIFDLKIAGFLINSTGLIMFDPVDGPEWLCQVDFVHLSL